ncbi:MAG: rRNA pseudouridine synthase [Ruminococcaceae bacterium]|nr:rRNA pseudouridine synthase [Oscillospiraceae bacterium]
MEEMRLQKYLAMANVASRRASERYILDGRVKVNGALVTELGTKVTDEDVVEVDGEKISVVKKKYYIMLNKPQGYVTTANDEFGRKTVFDLVGDIKDRLFPIGRLDADTEGLLLLTNDGDFTYKISHPSHSIEKVYHAHISGILTRQEADMLRRGVEIDGRYTAPAKIKVIEGLKHSCIVEVIICEGRNRQVRKMLDKVGHRVLELKRVKVGNVSLGNLPLGKWRHLTESEINILQK